MPTPSPISAPRIGAKPADVIAWREQADRQQPAADAGDRGQIGSSIANSEPNAMNSTIAAASDADRRC